MKRPADSEVPSGAGGVHELDPCANHRPVADNVGDVQCEVAA